MGFIAEKARCVEVFDMSLTLQWLEKVHYRRTTPNPCETPLHTFCFSAGKGMCVGVFHMGSGWFDYTGPSLAQGNKVCYTSCGWFNCTEPSRISSSCFSAEKGRCVVVFHMCSVGVGV